jgi:hypothetical protein
MQCIAAQPLDPCINRSDVRQSFASAPNQSIRAESLLRKPRTLPAKRILPTTLHPCQLQHKSLHIPAKNHARSRKSFLPYGKHLAHSNRSTNDTLKKPPERCSVSSIISLGERPHGGAATTAWHRRCRICSCEIAISTLLYRTGLANCNYLIPNGNLHCLQFLLFFLVSFGISKLLRRSFSAHAFCQASRSGVTCPLSNFKNSLSRSDVCQQLLF